MSLPNAITPLRSPKTPCGATRSTATDTNVYVPVTIRNWCISIRPGYYVQSSEERDDGMQHRATGTVIEFPPVGPIGWAKQACAGEDRIATVRRLAAEIADAADADHWSVSIDGVDVIGPADLENLVPRRLLQVLNGGRPATYRLSVPLGDLGVIRLATIRPGGFREANAERARDAADRATILLEATAATRDRSERKSPRPGAIFRSLDPRSNLRVCQPWEMSWDSFPPDAC